MRSLNGSDLAGFIKERQAHQVRGLIQAHQVTPKLAIVQTVHTPIIDTYVKLKIKYGADIQVEVEPHIIDQKDALDTIRQLNADPNVHGIIIQLPVTDPTQTSELVNAVDPAKDVDGLGEKPDYDPATPTAVNWLLAGYNIELRGKKIVIVGRGRLVGEPLAQLFTESGLNVDVADKTTIDLRALTRSADVLITATGQPGIITSDMIQPDAVVVDAGVATDAGKLVGDLAADVRERTDLTITPEKGGVGPLTVCALFENVIQAARRSADKN
jgi:methylenetetrahydrofolate dehydrogenase (NADP+) / methenyltetrahydrofolate cyclohydrolase